MRIGFDLSPLHRPFPPGVVRAVSESVRALRDRSHIEVVDLIPPPQGELRAWRKTLPARIRTENLVGLHSFTSAFPRGGPGKRVQTIHELPWRHGVKENADWSHRYWASLGARGADRVLCPTEHVASDLRKTWFAPKDRVRVIPWGVSDSFAEEPPLGVVDEVVQPKLTQSEDAFALCLGATREKKNLAGLLHGLAKLRERHGPRLQVVVGGEDTPQLRRDLGLASKLGLARWISTPGRIAEEDLPSAYRLASVVPVLSPSEGFAFPVLEALKSGTPVLVPEGSAQSEVAGELGITCDPKDPESIADGLERA
ncbi:MAG: glycosyltransferase family 1 protein, partial [Planctomycetota bacterium]